ncbi:DUF6879 family protein [Longispora urticae]
MELLQGERFENLFRTFARTAFHLELRDTYHDPTEAGPFELFLTGRPDDFAWHEPWLRLVREFTAAGKRMTRVRVVTVPHGDYTRWGLAVAPLNIDAGEDIRWLPRHLTTGIDLPEDDYWLFDDSRVFSTVFEDGGKFLGGTEVTDPAVVRQCQQAQDAVWKRAIPHRDYVTSEFAAR